MRDEQDHSHVIEDKNTSYLIKQLFTLYATGRYSFGSLSEEMGKRGLKTKTDKLLGPEQMKSILQNKFYIGKMAIWGKEIQGKHKLIIEESLFNQVQSILSESVFGNLKYYENHIVRLWTK